MIAALLVCMLACAQLGSASMLGKHMKHLPMVSAAPAVSGAPGSTITPTAVPVACSSVAAAAQAAGNFSSLLGAAKAIGFDTVLADPAFKGTVFAPTDAAFAKGLAALGVTSDQLLKKPQLLQAILMYHVVPGTALPLAQLSDSQKLPTLLSEGSNKYQLTLSVQNVYSAANAMNKRVTVSGDTNSAKVIAADVNAGCPAVIHVIDNVLIPGSENSSATAQSTATSSTKASVPSSKASASASTKAGQ